MKVYRDRGTVVALVSGLLLVTGIALLTAASTGHLVGWSVWVATALSIGIGLVVLFRVRHTTTTVDPETGCSASSLVVSSARVRRRRSRSAPSVRSSAATSKLDEEYPEHALVLVLTDGSRRTLTNHMSPERIDDVRNEIQALLES